MTRPLSVSLPAPRFQLNVGVGALAGSTILLLTVPWVLGILYGRVDIDKDGNGSYTARPKMDPAHRWLRFFVQQGHG